MLGEEIKHLGGGVGMYEKIAYCHRILEAANENQSFCHFFGARFRSSLLDTPCSLSGNKSLAMLNISQKMEM